MSFCYVDESNRSLFACLVENYHWKWSMHAEINDSPSATLQQYFGFTTTRKRFEPCHNLFTFPLVHSAPLHTIGPTITDNRINISSSAASTHLIQNLI